MEHLALQSVPTVLGGVLWAKHSFCTAAALVGEVCSNILLPDVFQPGLGTACPRVLTKLGERRVAHSEDVKDP